MPDFGDIDPTTGETSERTRFQGTVDPYAPSVANGQISPEQWAAYERKRKRDAIIGILSTLGATTGLGALGGAIGGAGAAGAATGGGAAAGGSLAPIAGGAPWALTPYAGTAASVGTGAAVGGGLGAAGAAGAGLGGAGSGTGAMFAGMSASDLASLGLAGAGMVGGAMSNNANTAPTTATTDPQLQELIALMTGRLRKSEPLNDSVLAMANGLLPTQYQNGGAGR